VSSFLDEHSDTHLIWTYTGTLVRWTILINQQIVFNIEKLINTICELYRIVHLNKYTGTY
jgi:hypothetical protein